MPAPNYLNTTAEGHAALAICESLLIALSDLKILSETATRDVLTDAATAHRGSIGTVGEIAKHETIAAIIDRIKSSSNSVHK